MSAVERFRGWFERAQLSAAEVARDLGVDASYVSHLRAGRRVPSLVIAARIEQLTGIPARAWVTSEPATDPASPDAASPGEPNEAAA